MDIHHRTIINLLGLLSWAMWLHPNLGVTVAQLYEGPGPRVVQLRLGVTHHAARSTGSTSGCGH